jgi:hypothetical protein
LLLCLNHDTEKRKVYYSSTESLYSFFLQISLLRIAPFKPFSARRSFSVGNDEEYEDEVKADKGLFHIFNMTKNWKFVKGG